MEQKSTTQLMKKLNTVKKAEDIENYLAELDGSEAVSSFSKYMEYMLSQKNIDKAKLIAESTIQRNYGYQVLNGDRHPGRDKIIALCIAGKFNIKETQRALEIASEGILYSKNKRDAAIIYGINNKMNIRDINSVLEEHKLEALSI